MFFTNLDIKGLNSKEEPILEGSGLSDIVFMLLTVIGISIVAGIKAYKEKKIKKNKRKFGKKKMPKKEMN